MSSARRLQRIQPISGGNFHGFELLPIAFARRFFDPG
jgi:hypothetical protein